MRRLSGDCSRKSCLAEQYTSSACSLGNGGPSRLEVVMSSRFMPRWLWRALLAGAVTTMPLTCGLMPRQVAAQYAYEYGYDYPGPGYPYSPQAYPSYPSYPSYGRRYHREGDWGSGRNGGRPWSEESWRRGDRSTPGQDRGADRRRTDEGRSGSSGSHGTGGAKGQGGSSSAGGNSGAANSWLGSHGSYR